MEGCRGAVAKRASVGWNDYCCKHPFAIVRDRMGQGTISHTRPTSASATDIRTGQGKEAVSRALLDNLRCLQGKLPQHATRNDWYMALAYTVRDRMIDRYISTLETMTDVGSGAKVVAYLSAEFLV